MYPTGKMSGYESVEEESLLSSDGAHAPMRRRLTVLSRIHVSLLYITNIILVITLVVISVHRKSQLTDPTMTGVYSPAQSAVEYQVHRLDSAFYNKTDYMGLPSLELDSKWDALTSKTISKIGDKEASQLFEPTMSNLDDPSEHLVILDVFHQIHCLNSIRKAFYPEYYPWKREFLDDGSENKDTMTWKHLDHCIDSIRQSLMCSGDISPVVYHIDPRGTGVFPKLQGTHVCRNWDKLRDWAIAHDASNARFLFKEGDALLDYYRTDPEGFMRKGGSE